MALDITVKEPDAPAVSLGDTTNLPQMADQFSESLWETLTFQRNINVPYVARTDKALGLSLAVQCAQIKARDLAKSEMMLWRKDSSEQYKRVKSNEHWFARLLSRRPNEYHSWPEFWRMVMMHYGISQNAYIWKDTLRNGTIVGLVPLPPARVSMAVGDDGSVWYDFEARTELERAVVGRYRVRFPADRIIHIRGAMWNGMTGLSKEDIGAPLFELIGAIGNFQKNLFANDGRMPIVFESDTAVFPDNATGNRAFERLKDQLRRGVGRMASHGDPILLEAGYKAKVIAQNSREAMTAEAFNAAIQRVCFLMEIPPHKIYALENIKYDNQAAMNATYANDILVPIAADIEDKFRLSLFSDDEIEEFYPEFDRLSLLAGDPASLVDIVDKAVKVSLMTFDEARERIPLGLNPYPNGQGKKRLLPTSFAIVDEKGEIEQLGVMGQPNNDGSTTAPGGGNGGADRKP